MSGETFYLALGILIGAAIFLGYGLAVATIRWITHRRGPGD